MTPVPGTDWAGPAFLPLGGSRRGETRAGDPGFKPKPGRAHTQTGGNHPGPNGGRRGEPRGTGKKEKPGGGGEG